MSAKQALKKEILYKILDLFLRENRQLFFLARKYSPPLAMNESYALGEISRLKLTTASQICHNMRIEKSTLSRLLKGLRKRALIAEKTADSDRRSKYLTLTTKGSELYSQNCHLRNLLVDEFGRNLSKQELDRFFGYVSRMADSLGAAPEAVEAYGSAYRHQMGRLTKAMRITSDNYMGCGLPISSFHILHLLACSAGSMQLYDLRRQLPYETSALTRLVRSLEDSGLIGKANSEFDRRHRHLKLTDDGLRKYQECLEVCLAEMGKALRGFSSGETADFTALHEKICTAPAEPAKLMQPRSCSAAALKSLAEFRRARAFLVRELALNSQLARLPETLLSADNFCFAVFQGKVIKGVLEIGRYRGRWTVLHFALSADVNPEVYGIELMRFSLKSFFARSKKGTVLIPSGSSCSIFLQRNFPHSARPAGELGAGELRLFAQRRHAL